MLRRYLIVVIAMAMSAATAVAGINGILTGKVTGQDKKPVSGATVRVLGTTRGGITKGDGGYNIVNIVAGTYDVRVTAIGYDTAVKRVSISADQTVTLNFVLAQGGIQTKVVDVSAEKEMVSTTDIGTSRNIKGSDLLKLGIDNTAAALGRVAGVQVSGNGFNIRGSRTTETQVLVDGLTVTDQFTGGLGNSGATVSAAMPSPLATEEVQAQTGGFGAEYGNAIGGVVNTVVKTGKVDRFEGILRWRKDVPFLFGKANNGIQAGSPLEDVVDATLGGPLGIGRSTFFVSVRNTFQNNRNFGLQVMDPIGNNIGMMPNNRTWSRNITGRLKFQFNNDIFLLVGGMYGLVNGERTDWAWLYANDQGYKVDMAGRAILGADGLPQYNGIPTRNAKLIAVQEFSNNAFAQINHTLGENTFYELRVSFNGKITETGKRKTGDAPGLFSGFDLYYPEDNMSFADTIYTQGPNKIVDAYDYLRTQRYSDDGLALLEVTAPNPITGYVEGIGDFQSTANPYGLLGYFAARGNEGGVDFRNARFWQVDGSITHNLLTGDTRHTFKAGFELRLLRLSRHYNANPWDGSPFYDVYGSDYGGNIYAEINPNDPQSEAAKLASEKPYTPTTASFFVQDQIQFKGLVFTPGLRVDYMNSDAMYRTSYDIFYPFGSPTGFASTKAKLYLSPRITVTYPVSDDGRKTLNLSYGIYYQAPPWSDYYDSFNAFQLRGSQVLGNPNMEMQRTNQYQIAYNHQFNDDIAITATGYYKDIYNQAGLAYVRIVPIPFYQRILADYGSSRGLELTLQKRMTNNWSFNLNYTLAQATGTANSSAVAVGLDPSTGQPAYPVTDFPLDYDRRHRVNGAISLEWGRDEGPTIGGIPFLEHVTFTLSGFWQTGLPYTPVDYRGQAAGQINSGRFPANWNSELRLVRNIPLGDVIGGNTSVDIFVDATNLFNFTDAIRYYTRTGSPDYDGFALNRVPGDFPAAAYYKTGDKSRKETVAPSQYDRVGRRLYNERIDYNSDGIVTQDETYRGYQEYVQTVVAQQANYQFPRQVYFGVTFRF